MCRWAFTLFVLLGVCLVGLVTASELTGVSQTERARYNWIMHCQGCHGVGARGSKDGAPNMVGVVAQFLHNQEGRAYLARVPGVAFVSLSGDEVAELLNWVLQTYDMEHLPPQFKPYSGTEVSQWRKAPLISGAASKRREILQRLNNDRE